MSYMCLGAVQGGGGSICSKRMNLWWWWGGVRGLLVLLYSGLLEGNGIRKRFPSFCIPSDFGEAAFNFGCSFGGALVPVLIWISVGELPVMFLHPEGFQERLPGISARKSTS